MKISDRVEVIVGGLKNSRGKRGKIIDSIELMTGSYDENKCLEPGNNECLKLSGIICHYIKFDGESLPEIDDGSHWVRENYLIKI